MLIATIMMGVIAAVLLAVGYLRGQGQHVAGVRMGVRMTVEMMPLLVLALLVAGLAQALLSEDMVSRWIGPEGGLRGIFVGSFAGACAPGGPFVSLPIAAGLLRAGAGPGTMVAFLTGWSLWAFSRLPMEVGILGWRFALVRLASTLLLPPLAGLIAHVCFGTVKY